MVLVTGFGPFEEVTRNPSWELARSLEDLLPDGCFVRALELPVSFEGAPEELARVLKVEPIDMLVGLGVQKEDTYRLERRARGSLQGDRIDNEGRSASAVGVEAGQDLETTVDLEAVAAAMREASGEYEVVISEDAGGYVCERTYHALLDWGRKLRVPAVFLHVPPEETIPADGQGPVVRTMVQALVAQLSSKEMSGRSSAD